MRKVVDAGFLRSDSVIEYLTADRANELVLTDYLWMESLKGRSTTNFLQQIKHIYKFPRQIQILKGTRQICRLSSRPSGLQRRIIDRKQTESFRAFCRHYSTYGAIKTLAGFDLTRKSDLASTYIASVTESCARIQEGYSLVKGVLGRDIISVLRNDGDLRPDQFGTIAKMILQFAAILMHKHPDCEFIDDFLHAQHHFLFRQAISSYALMLDWFTRGGVETVNKARLRNDMIDSTYVAYSTYFDGLLTLDQTMKRTRRIALTSLEKFQRGTAASP